MNKKKSYKTHDASVAKTNILFLIQLELEEPIRTKGPIDLAAVTSLVPRKLAAVTPLVPRKLTAVTPLVPRKLAAHLGSDSENLPQLRHLCADSENVISSQIERISRNLSRET